MPASFLFGGDAPVNEISLSSDNPPPQIPLKLKTSKNDGHVTSQLLHPKSSLNLTLACALIVNIMEIVDVSYFCL